MAGRQVARPQGGAFSQWSAGPHLNYNFRALDVSMTRRLHHTGLNKTCDYIRIPDETTYFSWDVLRRRDFVTEKTLSSNVVTMWDAVQEDVIIKEKFANNSGIALTWPFFHCVWELYLNSADWLNGESLVWTPFDRTFKSYPVDIINLTLDGEELNPKWSGDDKWAGIMSTYCSTGGTPATNIPTPSQMEIWLKLRPETSPGTAMFMVGGSDTAEIVG